MESRIHGVPLSAAQIEPKVVVLVPCDNNNNASPGIRAPITADDDSDFEYSPKSRRNSSDGSYYSSSDYEGFGSGEGDDEQRPYDMSDEDEQGLFSGKSRDGESNGDLQVPIIAAMSREDDNSDEDSQEEGGDVLQDDDDDGLSISGVVRLPSFELSPSVSSFTDNAVVSSEGEILTEEEGSVSHEVSIDEQGKIAGFSLNLDEGEIRDSSHAESIDHLLDSISGGSFSSLPSSQLNLHIDPKGMVVKMEEENKDLLSYPSEDILRHKTGDGLIITELDGRRPEESKSKVVALSKGEKKKLDKLQRLRAKYLTLLHRLGFSHQDSVPARVLHHLTAAESRIIPKLVPSLGSSEEDLDHSLSILVIGKTGVGKSATINSIFGERKTLTDPFQHGTVRVREINGALHGIKVKVFDTPGLRTCGGDRFAGEKVLAMIKKTVKKCPPDVVLYVDRTDEIATYSEDLHIFEAVDSCLGLSIWSKSIVVLTHANSLPLDESEGSFFPLSYEALVSRRSLILQRLVARGTNVSLEAPLSLVVENNPSEENGEFTFHFGESWRKKLLNLCCSIKTLSEANSIVSITLPFSPSSLLQSNVVVCPKQELMSKSSHHPKQEKGDKCIEILPPSCNNVDDPSLRYHFSKPSHRWDMSYGGYDETVGYFPARLSIELIKGSSEHTYDDGNKGLDEVLTLAMRKLSYGLKVERKYTNLVKMRAMTDDVAGISFACPISEDRSCSLGLCLTGFRDGIGYELESRFSIDGNPDVNIRAGLNRKGRVWISTNTSDCSDQLQLGGVALAWIASAIFKKIFSSHENHCK